MTLDTLDPRVQKFADSQVEYVRRMALLTDDQIRETVFQLLIEQPHLIEKHTEEEQTKMIHDIKKSAQDVKSSPLKFARKVDGGIKL